MGQHDLLDVEVVLVEVADAGGDHLQPALELVAVQVDEVAHVRDVVGRDVAEEVAVVVVLVVLEDRPAVQPREVVHHLQHQLVALVDLLQHLREGAGRVVRVLYAQVDDVQQRLGLGLEVGQPPLVARVHLQLDALLVLLVDVVEVGLAVVVVDVGDGRVLVLVGAGEVHLAVERQVHLHLLQQVLVGGLELVQPLHHVLVYHEQPVEHLDGRGEVVLRPLVHVGHVDHDPVVLEGVHRRVGQDHRPARAAQPAQEDALAGGSRVVEAGEVRHRLVDLQRRVGRQLFEPLREVAGAGRDLGLHDLLHGLVGQLEDVVGLVDGLQDGVDERVGDHRVAPDPHVVLLPLVLLGGGVDVVGQLLEQHRVVMLIIDVLEPVLGVELIQCLPVDGLRVLDGLHNVGDADGLLPDHY